MKTVDDKKDAQSKGQHNMYAFEKCTTLRLLREIFKEKKNAK